MSGHLRQFDSLLQPLGLRVDDWLTLPLPLLILAIVGGISILISLCRFIRVLLNVYVVPGKPVASFKVKNAPNGTWAVVTGATDGIGREFALQLAKKGFNIFLASRTPDKLDKVAGEIESASPGIKTKVQAIDFSAADVKAYDDLKRALSGLDIGVLINNVGKSHDSAVYFHETSEEEMESIVEINVNATLRVTRIVLPGMIGRKRGLILNMGSFAGAFPTPLLATYSGSKAFLIGWTQAVAEEVRSKGVTVQLLNTYFVVSAMSKIRRPSAMVPTPKAYVAKALASVGKQGGAVGRLHNNTPWPAHALLDWAISYIVPQSVMFSQSRKMQLAIKKRAEAKKARAAKTQ
ncbi:NAD(P)-binding protein [Tilletiaria anomala UBC 951]|uniref:Very-long-chain 3-oxoacyl-CoA reductase n=1 Tax=Tilletiaria anomala (strain ATCC 24038 / CBS 436.72 / UBC 951) TaxID=1037660 RepID=A0A066W7J7_TILAU|nr:NAD(P)-binding protein [Tilletiaria anomala UBC 951]KDN49917.1 NAD(P)-binding protein [Tilletiaria anomala UBC 951]